MRLFACEDSFSLRDREWLLVSVLVLTVAAGANSASSINIPATMAINLKLVFWPNFLSPVTELTSAYDARHLPCDVKSASLQCYGTYSALGNGKVGQGTNGG